MYSKICACLLTHIMFSVVDILLWCLKRISKVTLCQLLLGSIFTTIFFLFYWTSNRHNVTPFKMVSTNPVIVWWTEGFPASSETKYCPNNIVCDFYSNRNVSGHYDVQAFLFYGSNIHLDDLPLPRRPKDIVWGLYHEESPRNMEELMHEPILNLFNFSSTYSRYSDVPFPLQHLESFEDITSREYFVETSVKNSYLKDIAPILYLQSDCETSTERDLYVKELMKLTQIDSYGSCLNNKKLPEKFLHDYLNNLSEDRFLKFIARYKFVIAIENGVCDDYVTEKFWRAIKVGHVPIYFGSPMIKDWLPNDKSAILLDDFPTPKNLSDYLNKLLKDDRLYELHLEHKTKQTVTNFKLIDEFNQRLYQIDSLKTADAFECFVCEKIHDKLKGKSKVSIVDKNHYNCPKPVSALSLASNPKNSWVQSWEYKKRQVEGMYKTIMNGV